VFDRLALVADRTGPCWSSTDVQGCSFDGWLVRAPTLCVASVAGQPAFLEPGTPLGDALSTPVGGLSLTWTDPPPSSNSAVSLTVVVP
jgi:cobalt/nickel transport system permease protein